MPSFAESLEGTLHNALKHAGDRAHEYATLEHLLLALIDDADAAKVMQACGVDLGELSDIIITYLDTELESLRVEGKVDPSPTSGFQRVVQRAILHVQSSGKDVVTGANVLVALFSERESYAVYFLQQQDMSRLDAVSYISHGIGKDGKLAEPRPVTGAEQKSEEPEDAKAKKDKKEGALDQFTVKLAAPPKWTARFRFSAAGRRTTRFMWANRALGKPRLPRALPVALSKIKYLRFCYPP
jgi:ATP-dependent Clp protease ATP-binding subunit ClpA